MNHLIIAEWQPHELSGSRLEDDMRMLAEVLHSSVHAGAAVSFVVPFSLDDALAFWRDKVLPSVQTGGRCVMIAREGEEIIGTVQLLIDTPPNQPHRAEVAKLLVHLKARRKGVGRALMIAVEEVARSRQRTLLTLDTSNGDAAEPLYRSLGFVVAGVIPRYAFKSLVPELEATTIMYKDLL
jgi:ribosomal protein S18 acetylase RimI-like enzyme